MVIICHTRPPTEENYWLMLTIVLFEPEIAPNTGNIIRLCANMGAQLMLIKPLGFTWDDKRLRRAGLDYHEFTDTVILENFDELLALKTDQQRLLAFTTKGSSHYTEWDFQTSDFLLFGPETRGLPDSVLEHPAIDSKLRLPMVAGNRSLNLSNSVAIAAYEGWRQQGFVGDN